MSTTRWPRGGAGRGRVGAGAPRRTARMRCAPRALRCASSVEAIGVGLHPRLRGDPLPRTGPRTVTMAEDSSGKSAAGRSRPTDRDSSRPTARGSSRASPWYREPLVWMVLAIPAAAVHRRRGDAGARQRRPGTDSSPTTTTSGECRSTAPSPVTRRRRVSGSEAVRLVPRAGGGRRHVSRASTAGAGTASRPATVVGPAIRPRRPRGRRRHRG